MPEPPTDPTPEELRARTRALFAQADQELRRGISEHGPDGDHAGRLWRAQTCALVGTLGARVATAETAAEHLALAHETEDRIRDFYTAVQAAAAEPLTDGEYLRSLEAWRDLALTILGPLSDPQNDAGPDWQRRARQAVLTAPRRDDSRSPYEPPTLTGPHDQPGHDDR